MPEWSASTEKRRFTRKWNTCFWCWLSCVYFDLWKVVVRCCCNSCPRFVWFFFSLSIQITNSHAHLRIKIMKWRNSNGLRPIVAARTKWSQNDEASKKNLQFFGISKYPVRMKNVSSNYEKWSWARTDFQIENTIRSNNIQHDLTRIMHSSLK